jgi:hypothetical protein
MRWAAESGAIPVADPLLAACQSFAVPVPVLHPASCLAVPPGHSYTRDLITLPYPAQRILDLMICSLHVVVIAACQAMLRRVSRWRRLVSQRKL